MPVSGTGLLGRGREIADRAQGRSTPGNDCGQEDRKVRILWGAKGTQYESALPAVFADEEDEQCWNLRSSRES